MSAPEPQPEFFNEMFDADGAVREPYRELSDWITAQPPGVLKEKASEAAAIFRRLGITFAVYSSSKGAERLIPFDIIPRILSAAEWRRMRKGLSQRVRALNAFLHDIYHRQEIIRAGRVPADLIVQNRAFLPEMVGFSPPCGVYAHVVGIDIVRVGPDDFYALEDNLRTPSGVSYMLENREAMMHLLPRLFARHRIAPVEHYPELLRQTLASIAPPACTGEPAIVLLTPGLHNSAFFEHTLIADQMGVEMVEGNDLFVDGGFVYMRTTQGAARVDVIYKRIDDDFIDPLTFNADSLLGVAGLFDAYRAGHVTLANAPGTGIADDKAVYSYVPEIIEFYTGERPILKNVPTYRCSEAQDLAYVLDHLDTLVVKHVHGSGGYGMLVGPAATKKQRSEFARKLRARPNAYIAQPTLALSASPTYTARGLMPRHVDFRPFVLAGDTLRFTPGGLTRVAMKSGSLVVNSSQGGGTKDTWVLED